MERTESLEGFQKYFFWLLVLVEVTLFFPTKVNTYAITALVVFWLFHLRVVPGKVVIQRYFWLFFLLFFLFLVGVSYASNLDQGLKEIEKRSAFVVLPFILFSVKVPLGKKMTQDLIVYFYYAALIVGVALISVAIFRYFEGSGIEVFFYEELTEAIGLHPVYFSYYLLFGLVSSFIILYKRSSKNPYFWISDILGIILLLLLASKMVLAILLLLVVFLLIFHFKSVSVGFRIVVIVFFVVTIFLSVKKIVDSKGRLSDIFNTGLSDLTQDRYAYNYPFNGLSLRLVVWKLAIEHLVKDGSIFFGVGTGDATDYLNEVYSQHGLLDGGYINHNAHNEYVQTLITLGLTGLLYLIFVYGYGLFRGFHDDNMILIVFLFILVFSSLSESLLTVNKGVIFFSFFYPLLLASKK